MNGVNLFSIKVEKPAFSKASFQVEREKKCVKPTEKAKKLGKSLKCSTMITFPFGLHNLWHSFKNSIFSSCALISWTADKRKITSIDLSSRGMLFDVICWVLGYTTLTFRALIIAG